MRISSVPRRKGNNQTPLGGRRGATAYDRRGPVREPRPLLLIVCEGASTEPSYFGELKRRARLLSIDIEVREGRGGSTLSIVEYARQLARRDEYDEIWCVIDTEILATNAAFAPAVAAAERSRIRLAVSNPAFEYWYLLHFEETDRGFASVNQLIGYLKTVCLPDYVKRAGYTPPIFDQTDVAVRRAKRLLRRHATQADPFPHPSTTVYELVKRFDVEKPY
jgi:hypothetical protein